MCFKNGQADCQIPQSGFCDVQEDYPGSGSLQNVHYWEKQHMI